MRVIAALFASLGLAGPVFASYDCNSTDDDLSGTFTTQYGQPATLFAYVKYANHPEAVNMFAQIGAGDGSQNSSIAITTQTGADSYAIRQVNGSATAIAVPVSAAAGAGDGIWFPVLATFTSTTRRDVYAGALTTTQADTTSNDPGTAWDEIRLCESLANTLDATTLSIAAVGLVDRVATSQEITDFMARANPTSVFSLASDLIGYWSLATNNATQPNDGYDATGDLTVNGAAFNADQPTFGPVFTVAPTEAPATNGHTISGTVTGSGTLTVYAVSTNPAAAVPTCPQIKAGDDGSNVDARVAANEVWVTGVSNNFPLTEAGNAPESDVYVCASDGTTDTAVTSLLNQLRSPDASQAITELTGGLSATSPFSVQTVTSCDTTNGSSLVTGCGAMAWLQPGMLVDLSGSFTDTTNIIAACVSGSDVRCASGEILFDTTATVANATTSNITVTQDAFYVPTVASDDTVEGNTTTSGGGTITVGADGEVSCAGSCSGFQTWTYNIQDVSNATTGNFTSGPPNWGTDDLLYIGSTRPVLDILDNFYLFYEGVALSGVTLPCTDPDSQATSITSRSAVPTGTTLATSGAWTGTPTVEDEVGASYTFDCADAGLLYAAASTKTVYVTDDEITNPDGVGNTEDEYRIELFAVRPWLPLDGQTLASFECSDTVAPGDIISTNPAAAAMIDATEAVAIVVSSGSGEDGGFDLDSFDSQSFDAASFFFGDSGSCGSGGGANGRGRLSIGIGIGL